MGRKRVQRACSVAPARSEKALIFEINIPSGTPVQVGYVYDEARCLCALHPDTKFYAVITDQGT